MLECTQNIKPLSIRVKPSVLFSLLLLSFTYNNIAISTTIPNPRHMNAPSEKLDSKEIKFSSIGHEKEEKGIFLNSKPTNAARGYENFFLRNDFQKEKSVYILDVEHRLEFDSGPLEHMQTKKLGLSGLSITKLTLPGDSSATIHTKNPSLPPPYFIDENKAYKYIRSRNLLATGVLSALGMLLLYNFLHGFSLKHSSYFYFSAFVFSYSITAVIRNSGFLHDYFSQNEAFILSILHSLGPYFLFRLSSSIYPDLAKRNNASYKFMLQISKIVPFCFLFILMFQRLFETSSMPRMSVNLILDSTTAASIVAIGAIIWKELDRRSIKYSTYYLLACALPFLFYASIFLSKIVFQAEINIKNPQHPNFACFFSLILQAFIFAALISMRLKEAKQSLIDAETRMLSRLKSILNYALNHSMNLEECFNIMCDTIRKDMTHVQPLKIQFERSESVQMLLEHPVLENSFSPEDWILLQTSSLEEREKPLYIDNNLSTSPHPPGKKNPDRFHRRPHSISIKVRNGTEHFGVITFQLESLSQFPNEDYLFLNNICSVFARAIVKIRQIKLEAEKTRLSTEMAVAQIVQESLITESSKNIKGLEFSGYYSPSENTGGDWYSVYHDPIKQACLIACADVTGHGIPAAIVTGVVAGSINTTVNIFREKSKSSISWKHEELLWSVLNEVNSVVFKTSHKQKRELTLSLIYLDLKTGALHLANGGHNPPIIKKGSKIKKMVVSGNKIGSQLHDLEWPIISTSLDPGDCVVSYTDGLFENEGPDGKTLKFRHLKQLFSDLTPEESSSKIVEHIIAKGRSIWSNQPAQDDLTLVTYRWTGTQDEQIRKSA